LGLSGQVVTIARKGREVARERKKPRRQSKDEFHRRIKEIVDEKKLPVFDGRSADAILGYGEEGLSD